jgi:predicted metal-dependent hydrolase
MSSGIKKILRRANDDDLKEDVDKFLDRDMTHISEAMSLKMYATRMTEDEKTKL